MKTRACSISVFFLTVALLCSAQNTNVRTKRTATDSHQLQVRTVVSPTELAGMFASPLKCDADGNLYYSTTPDGVDGIHKVNAKGERKGVFVASSAPNLRVEAASYFSITPDGDVYQLVFTDAKPRYVVIFDSEGKFKSMTEIKTDFVWMPYTLVPFSSGEMFISGERYGKEVSGPKVPFSAIFAADGTLLRQVFFDSDEQLEKLTSKHDPKFTSPQNPNSNRALAFASAEAAINGRVYLMRRTSPASFYVIAPGGTVERTFTVDSGDSELMPSTMHISGTRIAVFFRHPQTGKAIIKVVDLEGKEVALYEEPLLDGKPALGTAFMCYSTNPDRFTFAITAKDSKLGFRVAEAN